LWHRPTADELSRMRCIIERVYAVIAGNIRDSFLENADIEVKGHSLRLLFLGSSAKQIIELTRTSSSEHLATAGLLNNDKRWCLVDFGAGRAELSYWLAKLAPSCRFLLIERMGSRNKFDNRAQKVCLISTTSSATPIQ
uniref:TRM13 domain-containing protein n=1 Tax=Gongylonema pulchrum TaxID=637853 RepID=A0A183DE76_9BILA